MNGIEHYREAERFIRIATEDTYGRHPELRNDEYGAVSERNLSPAEALAAAQVHATLAKAPAASVDLSEFAPGKAFTTVTIETPDGPIEMIAETVVA